MNYILPKLPSMHTTSNGEKIKEGDKLTIIIIRYELNDELEPTGNKHVDHLDVEVINNYGELSYNYNVIEDNEYHNQLSKEYAKNGLDYYKNATDMLYSWDDLIDNSSNDLYSLKIRY